MKQKKKKSRKNLFVPWNNNINIIKFSEFFFFKIIPYRTIPFQNIYKLQKFFIDQIPFQSRTIQAAFTSLYHEMKQNEKKRKEKGKKRENYLSRSGIIPKKGSLQDRKRKGKRGKGEKRNFWKVRFNQFDSRLGGQHWPTSPSANNVATSRQ